MIYLGVDPGLKGGICFLSHEGEVLLLEPLPTIQGFADSLEQFKHDFGKIHACVEKAQSFGVGGGRATFNYGYRAGRLEGVLVSLQIPFELVPPATWNKVMLAGIPRPKGQLTTKQKKDRSLEAALRLFPGTELKASTRSRVPHPGMFEALLIAEYARRKWR